VDVYGDVHGIRFNVHMGKVEKMINISLDLETWGTYPGCDLRSIGACVFDPVAGYVVGYDRPVGSDERPTFYQAVDNPSVPTRFALGLNGEEIDVSAVDQYEYKYPLTRDPDTIKWWADQSDAAQDAFADPADLRYGLIQFGQWLRGLSGDIYDPEDHDRRFPDDRKIWSHGAATDSPWIIAAYRAVGLPVPFHYRAPRDSRTCFDLAGIDDHSAWMTARPGPLGVPHHALDDAICLARSIVDAYKLIHPEQSKGFKPVERSDKKAVDWEYVCRGGERVLVRVAQAGASQ